MTRLLSILTAALIAATLTAQDLRIVTEEGMIFRDGKVERVKPLPERIELPEGATTEWDAETMTLTVTTPTEDEEGEPTVEEYTITDQEIEDALAWTPPPPVPNRVSKVQLKIALIQAGIALDALIASLPAEDQVIARILVDNADYFLREAGMVQTLGTAAGLSESDLDDLFRAAAQIDPASL